MGLRGPPKTPTHTLKVRGSWRAKERQNEPEVAVEVPPAPSWLKEDSVRYWDEIAPMLEGMRLIGKPYSVALGMLADALADYVKRSDQAAETPECVETAKGVFAHPIHGMKEKAWHRVMKAIREFGLSPASVASVTKSEGRPRKALDEFRRA